MHTYSRIPTSMYTFGTIPAGGTVTVNMLGAPVNATITIRGGAAASMGVAYDTDGRGLETFADTPIVSVADMKVFKCTLNVFSVTITGNVGDRYTII